MRRSYFGLGWEAAKARRSRTSFPAEFSTRQIEWWLSGWDNFSSGKYQKMIEK